jgi:HK97 family phage prohead protease
MSKTNAAAVHHRLVIPGSELRAVRAAEGGKRTLTGYAALYNVESPEYYGFVEEIAPGSFAAALRGEDDVRALVNHDPSLVIGRSTAGTLRLSDDAKGLRVEIDVPDTTVGRDLVTSIDRGDVNQMSFAFEVVRDEWSYRDANGRSVTKRRLLEARLYDVSAVTYPWYPDTEISARARGMLEDRAAKARAAGQRRAREIALAELT